MGLLASLLLGGPGTSAAAAAPLVGANGVIHACYKAKGKNRGAVRLVRSAKARCPRGWKKAAWNAAGETGAAGEQGSSGERGTGGEGGQGGINGSAGTQTTAARVTSLESKVTELLGQVKSLEAILAGVTNAGLKEAIAKVPVVSALCGQAKTANEQANGLRGSLAAFNTVLEPLLPLFSPVALPAPLSAFACP